MPVMNFKALRLGTLLLGLMLMGQALFAAAPSHDKAAGTVESPGTDLWRNVRQRPAEIAALQKAGKRGEVRTQVRGVDSAVLINEKGEQWRRYRVEMLVPGAMGLLGGVVALLFLLYLLFGARAKAPEDSGRRLLRFNGYERTMHWVMAGTFLLLGLTGLLLLFGRPLLIPLVGKEIFSTIATISKQLHDLVGPLFLVTVLFFTLCFWKRNLFQKYDLHWLLTAGGLVGGAHPRAGFFNMGEKLLFWSVALFGLTIALSGLMLLFPNFVQQRLALEGAHLAHTLGAVALLAAVSGHIYMAFAVKGTLPGMTSGYVELNWARSHHSEWARQQEEAGDVIPRDAVERDVGTLPPTVEKST